MRLIDCLWTDGFWDLQCGNCGTCVVCQSLVVIDVC